MTRRARGVAAAVALATLGAAATVEEDEGDAATLARGTARAAYAAATVATMVVDYKLAKRETWRSEGGAHDRNAKRLHAMCGANGGLYVKAGQFASTAGGVPEAYARRLSKLQDEVAPSPRDAVLKVVRNEFGGRAPEALFETFEPEPMAAASLAQVHRAVLKSGRTVAVKIQRPGLERSIESDISTMSALVRFTRLFFPSFDFGFMVDEFKSRLEKEIDFEAEGRNCERLGLAFADDARIDTPEVFWDLTTRRVLTMEFIDGEKLTNIEGMREKGLDPEHAALALSDCFARMLLVHGYIHGDPHPGNLLCRAHPDGGGRTQVVLLDHGLYSELTEESRKAMSNLWIAIAVGDSVRAVAAAKALQVPDEFAWLMPLALARKTPSGEPVDRTSPREAVGRRQGQRRRRASRSRRGRDHRQQFIERDDHRVTSERAGAKRHQGARRLARELHRRARDEASVVQRALRRARSHRPARSRCVFHLARRLHAA